MRYQATLALFSLSLALGGCAVDGGLDPEDGDEPVRAVEQALCPGAQMKASGYAWADQPLSASYTPSLGYQHNSSGGTNTITRSGTGSYTVKFPGLGGSGAVGGVVHVSAYGGGSASCKVSIWWFSSPNDISAGILCFDGNGAPLDTFYDVSFSTYPTEVVNHGYVWANDPFSAFSTPSAFYQFNSTCASNTITRSGVGKYTVKFPGLAAAAGDPQPGGTAKVTAYGPSSDICKVESWTAAGGSELVEVRCYTAMGPPVDTQFTATYTRANNLFGQAAGKRGYVRADQPSTPSYAPIFTDQFNSTGAPNTVTRLSAGSYTVKFPGLGTPGGHAQVSGAGLGSGRCTVAGWGPTGTDEFVAVQCYTQTAVPSDTQFTLSFYQP